MALRDTEIALMDAMKTVLDLIIVSGIAKGDAVGKIFEYQRDGYIAKKMPDAAAMMELLRQFVTDPERAAGIAQFQQFRREPPKGSA